MQEQLEVQASFPTVQGLLGAWRADLSNLPQRYWFLVKVSSLPVKALATSHWCWMELQDRAAQNTEKRKLGPWWWETTGDCEVWTINLQIQDNDRIFASLWLSQYSNLLVCLSFFSLSVSLFFSLSLSYTHSLWKVSRDGIWATRDGIWLSGGFSSERKVSEFMMLRFSGSPLTLQRRLCSTCQGHLSSNAPTKYGSVAAGQQGFFLHPPGITPYYFSAQHRLSILSDFDSVKLFTAKLCWEF